MCFWVFPKESVDLPCLLSFQVACGDQIFDNSTIMIKSSDKSLQNTYRILRVLSNKDYLATDHEGGKYIFSQTKTSLLANIPKVADHIPSKTPSSFLLHHIQILTIDNLQYAVFGVGNHEVIWAPLIKSKLLESQKRVQKIFEHSILNLLKELIWMGGKAKQYLDMRNFWFVNEDLCLLLIPRMRKNSNSLRKSEQVFQDRLSTIDAVIDTEKTLMKEFGLLLWQICFQQNFYESLDSQKHLQVKQILQKIIGKVIQFEELVRAIKKKQVSQQNGVKVRFKNKSKMDIFSRRKTTGSIEKSQNSSSNSLGLSRMNTGFTENLKGVRSLEKGNTSSVQKINQNTIFHRKFYTKQNRSMSQGDNLSNNASRNPRFAHPRLFQRHEGQQQSKNTIHYQTWLQKKKYSYDMKQKLLRNSLVARQKYNQTILNSSDEKQIPKFEDSNFKDKILAKVIKFKSAFKSNYSTINKPEQMVQTQKHSQTIDLNQIPQKLPYNFQAHAQNIERNQKQMSLSLKREYEINLPSNSTVAFRNNGAISSNNSQQNNLNRSKRTVESNRKKYEQGRNSKYQRSNVIVSSYREQDLQVVELRSQSNQLKQKQQKQQTKFQQRCQVPSYQAVAHSKIEDFAKVKEIFDQSLLLINILGDITVRAVKIKEKLSELNWRLITYFLYQRFYYQREKLVSCMEKGQVIFRLYTTPPSSKQWIAFSKSEEYQLTFHKIKQQNVQILVTLEKLGRKLLQEGELDEKIEHFLRNQKALSARKNSKLRSQLCRFLAATIINQYQFVVEQAMNQELITRFLTDCTFGMMIISELEGLLPRQHLPDVNNYKQYGQGLSGIGKSIDLIQKMLANSK